MRKTSEKLELSLGYEKEILAIDLFYGEKTKETRGEIPRGGKLSFVKIKRIRELWLSVSVLGFFSNAIAHFGIAKALLFVFHFCKTPFICAVKWHATQTQKRKCHCTLIYSCAQPQHDS